MKMSPELLEPRRLLSGAIADYNLMISEEYTLVADLSTAHQQEAQIRGALQADLSRLHLLRANAAIYSKLIRDETNDLRLLNKDDRVMGLALNQQGHNVFVAGGKLELSPNNRGIQSAFASTLAKFEEVEANDQQQLMNASVLASTGPAVSDLDAIAAIDPSDSTLQSDAQSGVANLTASATALTTVLGLIDGYAGTLISDSSIVEVYGTVNLLGMGFAAKANPFAGASLEGLAPNVTSAATNKYVGPSNFTPPAGDYPGTDQIYVGSNTIATLDEAVGPQVITLNYSALTRLGHPISTFTLGIATDGFENPTVNIPYTASINGVPNAALTSLLNGLNNADRVEQFVSIGIDPAQLLASKVLTITIDGPGDNISGWAVDFLTVGIRNA
jgi:hypothetical protein